MYSAVKISSKRQITIPSKIFDKLSLSTGDILAIEENNGTLIVQKEVEIFNSLKGILTTPRHLQGIDIDTIIQLSKEKHFRTKHNNK